MDTLKSYNPTTGELLKSLPVTSKDELQQKIERSRLAQKSWGKLSTPERCDIIIKAYEKITERASDIADLIHKEMGKTPAEAAGEVKYYSGGIKNLANEVTEALAPISTDDGTTKTTTYYDPLGVCASITPWNFPMGMAHTLMMPSLMAGNTVLFKPSEEVTLIGMLYAEILNETLPKDVLQVIIGAGEQGKQLVESDIQLVTFTGSQNTGKHILSSAGKELKRVLLELGGKDPLIIDDEANIDEAAQFAARNGFRNAGQVCVSTEAVYVTEKNFEPFLDKLKTYASDFNIGSMIHSKQKDHVIKQVKDAIKDGATLAFGNLDEVKENYVPPMILTGVTENMNIMIDETFGPVICVMKVKDTTEAIIKANNVNYALGAAVFSENKDNAHNIARQLKAGMVGINRGPGGAKGSPWVGAGQSGYGFHGSKNGHRQFAQVRIVSENLS